MVAVCSRCDGSQFADVINRSVADANRLHEGWDLMYLTDNDWAKRFNKNRTAVGDLLAEQRQSAIAGSSVEVAGCMAGTLGYVISHHGAAKMLRMKRTFLSHFVTIDDMFMSLGGRSCTWHWDAAAKLYASAAEPPTLPYRVLNVLKTRAKLCTRRRGSKC